MLVKFLVSTFRETFQNIGLKRPVCENRFKWPQSELLNSLDIIVQKRLLDYDNSLPLVSQAGMPTTPLGRMFIASLTKLLFNV